MAEGTQPPDRLVDLAAAVSVSKAEGFGGGIDDDEDGIDGGELFRPAVDAVRGGEIEGSGGAVEAARIAFGETVQAEPPGEFVVAVLKGIVNDRSGSMNGERAEDGDAGGDGEGEERFGVLGFGGEEQEGAVGEEAFDERGEGIADGPEEVGGEGEGQGKPGGS